jgi:hypothetical protein
MGTAVLLAAAGRVTAADDNQSPSLLGRLFRMGGAPSANVGGSNSGGASTPQPGASSSRLPYGGSYYNSPAPTGASVGSTYGNSLPPGGSSVGSSYGNALPPGGGTVGAAAPLSTFGGLPETPQVAAASGPADRLTPRSRVSTAVTNADPVLTRFALGKSNDGSSFGMFLEIFADGTVVDSEGVHHVRPADLKPIMDAVQSGEMYRLRGHCGAPSTDFIEYVHIVAYERRLGRLQAHAFSYSGNPQGCDHVIRHLHTSIETLQTKLSRQPTPAGTAVGSAAPAPMSPAMVGATPIGAVPAPMSMAPIGPAIPGRSPALPSTATGGSVIPLTSADTGR